MKKRSVETAGNQSAFPETASGHQGITLRLYIASMVLAGMRGHDGTNSGAQASLALELADALIDRNIKTR